jgi:hypothetical protein
MDEGINTVQLGLDLREVSARVRAVIVIGDLSSLHDSAASHKRDTWYERLDR